MKKARASIMIIFVVLCLITFTACMKGAPDDAYMIDLTCERDVVIENSIEYVAMGDFDSFVLYEQLLLEEYGDAFNSEIHNIGRVEKGDKKKAIEAAEYFLKEYFGTRYIDAGNGKVKVRFEKDAGLRELCYYRCGAAFVVFETGEGSFRGCFDLRIQTYLRCKDESIPWRFAVKLNMYEQSAERLRFLHEIDPKGIDKPFQFDKVHDAQTAFAAAKKMSAWARCQEKEFKVYFSPNSNAWFVCAKHWIIAFGENNTILYSAISS